MSTWLQRLRPASTVRPGSMAVLGASCVFPSGPNLALADTAVRTNLALLRNHPHYVDSCGMRVKAHYFPDRASGFDTARWCELARVALDELVNSMVFEGMEPSFASLVLVLPDAMRPGVPTDLFDRLILELRHPHLIWLRIDAIRGGHAAGVQAMEHACAVAQRSADELIVVLAVDSLVDSRSLQWLEAANRLHGAHRRYEGELRPNPYGRVPGEAAAAVAIGRASAANADWAQVLGIFSAEEAVTCDDPRPCLGAGLTQAAQSAVQMANVQIVGPITRLTTDLNGEPYRGDEFGFVSLRLAESLSPGRIRDTPVLASSDIGAASAVAHAALAAYRIRQAGRTAGKHLILSSSDDELRGAVVLGPAQRPRRRA